MFYKTFSGLTAILLSLAAGSAFAGPDWAAIERARAERKAQVAAKPAAPAAVVDEKVQPVNHGPRAEFRPLTTKPEAPALSPTNVARQ